MKASELSDKELQKLTGINLADYMEGGDRDDMEDTRLKLARGKLKEQARDAIKDSGGVPSKAAVVEGAGDGNIKGVKILSTVFIDDNSECYNYPDELQDLVYAFIEYIGKSFTFVPKEGG